MTFSPTHNIQLEHERSSTFQINLRTCLLCMYVRVHTGRVWRVDITVRRLSLDSVLPRKDSRHNRETKKKKSLSSSQKKRCRKLGRLIVELVSPRIHASPPTLWTVLPTCLGTRLGSVLKRGRPLVLRSGTVSWVLSG